MIHSVQLAENLKPFELENLDRINLIEHPERKGKNRGYAFLDFRTHVDAVDAFLKLQERDLYLGTDFRAHISFSNTLSQDDEIMEKVQQQATYSYLPCLNVLLADIALSSSCLHNIIVLSRNAGEICFLGWLTTSLG